LDCECERSSRFNGSSKMRVKTIEILRKAMEGGYAVGAFNTANMEITQGIARAAHECAKPCIIQITTTSLKYAGKVVLGDIVKSIIENETNSTQVGMHLDHGKTMDEVVSAIDLGVDSVMIDASRSNFKDNLSITSRVVEYAHKRGVSVQAELGNVPYLGKEELDINWDEAMTNPEQAKELIVQSGADALAVGIGNAHGFFRERPEPDWDRLKKIRELIPDTPLILHGASDWDKDKVEKAIKEGIVCFNIDTDIRIAFCTAMCSVVGPGCEVTDPRKILGAARESVQEKVMKKIKMFNSL